MSTVHAFFQTMISSPSPTLSNLRSNIVWHHWGFQPEQSSAAYPHYNHWWKKGATSVVALCAIWLERILHSNAPHMMWEQYGGVVYRDYAFIWRIKLVCNITTQATDRCYTAAMWNYWQIWAKCVAVVGFLVDKRQIHNVCLMRTVD